ncbi:MAG: flap endonuclease [Gammaproteobacteria bacterium]|jgi:DNA polymerase-1|nr:flap endonuclease [Gammaproteobacteria bacterium]
MTLPLYLVDASIYIFRSYFSIPPSFFAKNGELVNAVYGYTNFLLDLIKRNPKYISVAFDESLVSCFRNKIYPDYKANRDLPDENLEFQLAMCQKVTGLLGFHHLSLEAYEADDIIGTLHKRFALPTVIVTRDKDLGQLIGSEDRLWDFASDAYSGPGEVQQKFGVRPDQIADYLALAGDSVDNIPGAPGIGAKIAAALLTEFGSIEKLYASLDKVPDMKLRGAKKVYDILLRHRDDIDLYRRITGIACDIPIKVTLEDLRIKPQPIEEIMGFFDEMAFSKRIRDRLGQT